MAPGFNASVEDIFARMGQLYFANEKLQEKIVTLQAKVDQYEAAALEAATNGAKTKRTTRR